MQYLKSQPIWVLWKLTDNTKRPISAITGHETGSSKNHAHEWTTYSDAAEKTSRVEAKKGKEGSQRGSERGSERSQRGTKRGLGFIIPEGYFFLDVDHQGADSLLVQELKSLLPTYCEVSPSGNGVHFYGKCDINRLPITTDGKTDDKAESNGTDGKEADGKRAYSKGQRNQRKLSKEYYTKNPQNGLELYIGGLTNRFSTFTGNSISAHEQLADCTEALLQILEQKMKKSSAQSTQLSTQSNYTQGFNAGPDDATDANATPLDNSFEDFVKLSEADIPQILSDLRKQKNAKKFISLFDEGEIPVRKTQSEADVALCAIIAFRAGPNPELIDSIFRQSALYRPKWDREDYASRTISAAIEACHGNFHPAVRRASSLPPFIILKKGKRHVSISRLEAYIEKVMPYIIVRDSAGWDSNIYVFRNGVYCRYSREVFAGAIKSLVKAYDPDLIDDTALDKTVSLICKSEKYVNFESLNTDELYINLQNGLLDIKTMKLLPHDPKIYSTIQLPLSFDPTALATLAAFGSLGSTSDTAETAGGPTSVSNSSNLAVVPAHSVYNDSNNNGSSGGSNNSGGDNNGLNSAHSANSLNGFTSLPASHDSHASSSALATLDSHALATPVFDRYLNTLTNGQEDKKRFLLEYLGACLSNVPGFKMKKALFLYGVGDTGKSLLKRLAERLLGIGNYTGIDLSQMEERFGASSIYGKRLAGSADMSFMTISELKIFKKATGGDVIRTEFKGKDSFDFTYKGLLWFCMNRLPKFGGDNGQWVYDRIIPVHCPTVIEVSKQDTELLDKMYEERVGIFYKAIMAFRAVIENGYKFHEPAESIALRRQYRVDNNTALEFFSTMMEKRAGGISREDDSTIDTIYKSYREWYSIQNYKEGYRKNRKEFFTDIADFLGEDCEAMKDRRHGGYYLKDYMLKKEAPAVLV